MASVSTVGSTYIPMLTVINVDREHALSSPLSVLFDSRSEGVPRQKTRNQNVSHHHYYLVVCSIEREILSRF